MRSKSSSSGVAPCSIVSSLSCCEDPDSVALLRFLLSVAYVSLPQRLVGVVDGLSYDKPKSK
jgi:hypothetical protein